MVTRLDPLLPTPHVRSTEATDTRMAIRRDESKDPKQRGGGSGHEEFSAIPWEDTAGVSTAALKVFLQSLLGMGPAAATPDISAAAMAAASTAPKHEPTTMTARASNAYLTTGRAVHDRNIEAPAVQPAPVVDHPETVVLGHDFTEADRKTIAGFLTDLSELERRGVSELTVQRSLTFMDGVSEAIKLAKSQLS